MSVNQWRHKGWCLPGWQTDGVTLIFFLKKLVTFLVIIYFNSRTGVTPIFSLEKLATFLVITPFFCHLPPSNVDSPVFFINSATKISFFHSGVTPLDGVTLSSPPSDDTAINSYE